VTVGWYHFVVDRRILEKGLRREPAMGRRHREPGAVRSDAPTVLRTHVRTDADAAGPEPVDQSGEVLAAGCEAAEPEEYGVRVDWQPVDVRIEAAEFLVATRTEHEKRLRATSEIEHRHHPHDAT
jgi:hypothetical protein